ncbi:hypothetical protein M011DRAFT_461384 [Sporormia fimetaria CBS 119925]|uniref:WKF domain-containing protein n=1 Tax=Sporormia fimetaria CBS 119925 TaxID=1340428 RepID=A0A6A6UZM5_9PLEO|nr:hypothetical protein M011DRAFT_461384 [Sporormia fimetaria CBS 119925]
MESEGRPIPAWKRLGLTLKGSNQSGDTVALPTPQKSAAQPALAQSDGESGAKSHGAPESSNLGKRKHQIDEAEQSGQSRKKTRASGKHEEPTAAIATNEDYGNAAQETALEPAAKQQPKGDPNYRKKKTKAKGLRAAAEVEQKQSLLPSTELHEPSQPVTPKPSHKTSLRNQSIEASPPLTGRRKSVAFTPDTKTVDGHSASNLFKKWVAEQRGAQADFSQEEVSQFTPPPRSHPANGLPAPSSSSAAQQSGQVKEKKKKKKKQKAAPTESEAQAKPSDAPSTDTLAAVPNPATGTGQKGKKKDPNIYLSYLEQYYHHRDQWKFNKAKQNDVLDNALNVFRIPDENSEALLSYVKGLKGAGVVERLKTRCQDAIKELDEAEQKQMAGASDIDDRKQAKEEALQARLAKEKKRRRTEADVENLADHPDPEGYVRRLKRSRAVALLDALNLASPLPPPVQSIQTDTPAAITAPKRNVRKRKSRTEVSSDESSSNEDTSSDDSSDDSDSDSESSSSSSESDSDSEGSSSSDSSTPDNAESSSSDTSSDQASSAENSSDDSSDSASSDSSSESSSDSGDEADSE